MQALVFRGERQIAVEEVPEVRPGSGEVLIDVAYCGICGSDLHGYLGHSARRNRSIPLVMGHEFSGRIAALGEGVTGSLQVGQRVAVQPASGCGVCRACRSGRSHICPTMSIVGIERAGAFAPTVVAPADRVFALPDNLSDQVATLAETLAVEVHLFREMAPALPRTVLVLGAGAQGLLAVQLARLMNASEIIVSDMVPARLELAKRLGATHALHAREQDVAAEVKALTGGWGTEFAVETTGAPAARLQGLAALAPGATFGLVGLGEGKTTVDFLPIVAREIALRGSYAYSDDDFQRSIELLASGQVQGEPMLSVAPLSAGPEAFEALVTDPADRIKVLLQPI